jgi:hypothetical protein
MTMNEAPRPDIEGTSVPNLDLEIARYYYDQRAQIHQDAPVLRSLMEAVNCLNDLEPAGWAQWYSVALGFKPDLIVELGRGYGNSTALFCQAAARLPGTRVVSLCSSRLWANATVMRLKTIVRNGWFDPLDVRTTDILDVDYAAVVKGSRRVLLLWDAHGFQIAEVVLGRILPLLAGREHLVIMHDITDTRHACLPKSYEGLPMWKGSTSAGPEGHPSARVNIGWMNSAQEQIVAIADFSYRNGFELGSADHAYAQFFTADPMAAADMTRLLGVEMFSLSAHWAFFSLSGRHPLHFPSVTPRFRNRSAVKIQAIDPRPRWYQRRQALPWTISTSPVAWRYAAVMGVRPAGEVPTGVARSMRVRVCVERADAGIGLLSADQSVFVRSARIGPSADSQTIWFELDPAVTYGPLVVHTWDTPERAQVTVEDISIVW